MGGEASSHPQGHVEGHPHAGAGRLFRVRVGGRVCRLGVPCLRSRPEQREAFTGEAVQGVGYLFAVAVDDPRGADHAVERTPPSRHSADLTGRGVRSQPAQAIPRGGHPVERVEGEARNERQRGAVDGARSVLPPRDRLWRDAEEPGELVGAQVCRLARPAQGVRVRRARRHPRPGHGVLCVGQVSVGDEALTTRIADLGGHGDAHDKLAERAPHKVFPEGGAGGAAEFAGQRVIGSRA